jgi:uncharacterized phage protein (TIGR02216 family)
VLAFGLLTLRLPLQDLWLLTPREIALCAEVRQPKQFVSRAHLAALMKIFPDGARDDEPQ